MDNDFKFSCLIAFSLLSFFAMLFGSIYVSKQQTLDCYDININRPAVDVALLCKGE